MQEPRLQRLNIEVAGELGALPMDGRVLRDGFIWLASPAAYQVGPSQSLHPESRLCHYISVPGAKIRLRPDSAAT